MIFKKEWGWRLGYSMAQSSLETLSVVRNTDTVVSSGKMVAFMRVDLRRVFIKVKAHTTMQTSKKLMLVNSDEVRWMAWGLKNLKMVDTFQGRLRMGKSMEKD